MKTETTAPKRKYKHWTIREIEYMRTSYAQKTVRQFAVEFGVSEEKIDRTLRRYGIAKRKPRGVRDPRFAEMFEHIDAMRSEVEGVVVTKVIHK